MTEPEIIAPELKPEMQPEPVKVVFDEAQKARINEIVKEASKRAGVEARAESERLRKELEGRKTNTPPAEETVLQLAETRAELASIKAAAAESQLKGELLQAASAENFIDASLAADLLARSVKIVGGKPVVVDPSTGEQRLGANFEPMTLKEAMADLARQKSFLVHGRTRPGSGSTPTISNQSNSPKLEDLFGRKSNGAAANTLAMRDPGQYRRLKSLAREKGLI